MAKKKKEEKIIDDKGKGASPSTHPILSVYHILALLGVDPTTMVKQWEPDDKTHVSLAIPERKFAICFDGDKPGNLENEKWVVQYIQYSDIAAFDRVFRSLDTVRIAESYVKADNVIKSTSKHEEWLWQEMIMQNIEPMPDRNYVFRRDDGTELTTPDFTWEEYRIAFFMDGSYWHSVNQDNKIIEDIAKTKELQKYIVDTKKDKTKKDKEIRSELASRGWIILSCSDEELQEDGGTFKVVKQIKTAIENAKNIYKLSDKISSEDKEAINDFFD